MLLIASAERYVPCPQPVRETHAPHVENEVPMAYSFRVGPAAECWTNRSSNSKLAKSFWFPDVMLSALISSDRSVDSAQRRAASIASHRTPLRRAC